MQKKLEYLIKILIGASFFVPLLVFPSSYIFPFIVPKIVWFRSIVMLMLGAYLLLLSVNWVKYRIRWTPVNIAVALFFISFAVSTFVGLDWYRSFWDNHERMLGLFTIFHYVVYYFIVTSVVREWKDWKWLLRTFLFAGGIVMFIGILQKFANPELLLNHRSGRVSATLGNSIYYSGYGLFLMFIGYLLAVRENNDRQAGKMNPWFCYAVVAGALGFLGIFLGGTRGAMLGLMFGLGILALSYLVTIKDHNNTRKLIAGLMVAGVIIGSLFFVYRKNDFVKNIPGVGRLVNASLFEGTGATRLMAWGIAVDAWQEKPIFGWGPNNYYYAFNKYYNPKFLEHGLGETWFDNAHSVVMNTLAVQGTVGILTYFGMLGTAVFMLWYRWKKGKVDLHIVGIGTAFIGANFVAKALVFDDPTSYLYFFFFLALIHSEITNSNLQTKDYKSKNISTRLSVIVVLVVLLLIYSTNINAARANQSTLNVIRKINLGQNVGDLYNEAKEIPTPHIDDIRNDVSRIAGSNIDKLVKNNQTEEAMSLYNSSYSDLKKNLELHPMDIRLHIQLFQICSLGAQLKQDASLLFEAESYLEQALVFSPKRQQLQYILSGLKFQLGKNDEAIKLLQDSIDNDPKIDEGWLRLAFVYQQLGDLDQAKEILQEAIDSGVVFDRQGQNIISSILQSN